MNGPLVIARARRVAALGLALALGTMPSCVLVSSRHEAPPVDGGTDAGPGPAIDSGVALRDDAVREMLGSIGERVIVPTLCDFDGAAAELERATAAYAGSLSDADRTAAQDAWRAAIAGWQQAELMQLGPAGMTMTSTTGVYGGRDLRDAIYAWPAVSVCRIDQETVSGDYESPETFAATEAVNVRGLAAIEYLLFAPGTGNQCAASSTINTTGAWSMLGDDGVRARRAAYAHSLAVLVHGAAMELCTAWRDGFAAALGAGTDPYPSLSEALNALTDAMFYLDTIVKDMKVAKPAALSTTSCLEASCPAYLESLWAGASREHLIANLEAFQRIYLGDRPGTDAPGFDDLLRGIGSDDLDARLTAAIAEAVRVAVALPPLTRASLPENVEALVALYTAIRGITDLLKTEFVTVLDLDLPADADGDND